MDDQDRSLVRLRDEVVERIAECGTPSEKMRLAILKSAQAVHEVNPALQKSARYWEEVSQASEPSVLFKDYKSTFFAQQQRPPPPPSEPYPVPGASQAMVGDLY